MLALLMPKINHNKIRAYRPTSACTLVEMMNDATPPNIHPTNRDPIASGVGEFVYVDRPIQPAANITLATAAASSNNTTFTDGSSPRITYSRNETFACFADCFIELIATISVAPSDKSEPPSMQNAQKKSSHGTGVNKPCIP